MQIFFTSFTEGKAGKDITRIHAPMASLLNRELADRDYGPGLKLWFLMFVIVSPGFPGAEGKERVMYKKKDQSTDLRLFIDPAAYAAADAAGRQQLVYACIRRSLDLIADKNIPDFDIKALTADVEAIAAAQGWQQG